MEMSPLIDDVCYLQGLLLLLKYTPIPFLPNVPPKEQNNPGDGTKPI
jgi:hypothetical protein